MTKEEFEKIIKPLWLIENKTHRNFLIESLKGNFDKWKEDINKDSASQVKPRLFAITGKEGWNELFWNEEKAHNKMLTEYKKDFPNETFWVEEILVQNN